MSRNGQTEARTLRPGRSRVTREREAAFGELVARLSRLSVDKHYDAYADIAWDATEHRIDPTDERWILPRVDPLGATDWYRAQPLDRQARMGLWRVATVMKIGAQFENVQKRGLLVYASSLPNHSLEFRYVYHETVEEAHHGMMFQEFVNRTGLPIEGMPRWMRDGASAVVLLARFFPEVFFFFMLAGEEPLDLVQREALHAASTVPMHPLLVTVMRHHVTEEARHLSFAHQWLRSRVPELGRVRRALLRLAVPCIASLMSRMLLAPPRPLIREFGVPRAVVRDAYRPATREQARRALARVRALAVELDVVSPASKPLWKALSLWDDAR